MFRPKYHILIQKEDDVSIPDNLSILSSPDAVDIFARSILQLDSIAEEEVYLIAVDTKKQVLGISLISHGTVDSSIIQPREVFQRALLIGASSIFIIHNHPSQVAQPSKEDIQITKRLKEVGILLGVELLDHVIIGDIYFSFRENNLL